MLRGSLAVRLGGSVLYRLGERPPQNAMEGAMTKNKHDFTDQPSF